MPQVDPVILQLRADVARYRAEVRATTTQVDRQLDQQERAFADLNRQVQASSGQIGGAIKGLAGSFAAYLSGRELIGIIDNFTRFQNQLRVAGVAADDFTTVQDRLFASAQRYGVELGALGGLFGTLTQASKELGASQEQVFKLTDSVSAALAISGQSAGEASGALQQLGQALRGGTIQAEEYNSLLDGLYPLLEAAAQGSDRFGGSVATLTTQVKNGEVTSKAFFEAILAGSEVLQGRAQTAVVTVSGAYTKLSNALTVYVGQAAQAGGAQQALTAGITTLAENLDTVADAVAVIATVFAGRFVAGMVAASGAATAASVSVFALQARMAGAATTAEALALSSATAGRAVLAAFGGPVGLAVTALVAGVYLLSTRTDEAAVASGKYADQQRRLVDIQGRAKSATDALATATGQARTEALANAKAVQAETQQYLANARAALTAARAKAEQARSDAQVVRQGPAVITGSTGAVGVNFAGQRTERARRQAETNERAAADAVKRAEAQLKRLDAIISAPAPRVPPIGGGGTGGGRIRRVRSAPTAATSDVMTAAELIDRIRKDTGEIAQRAGSTILLESERLERAAELFRDTFGREGVDYDDPFAGVERYDRDKQVEADAREEAARDTLDRQEDQVRSLASLYEDLFTRGTDEVWRNFKNQGLRAIAMVLAQATVASFSRGGGGFGSLLGNIGQAAGVGGGSSGLRDTNPNRSLSEALSLLFGRASGGYVAPGQTVRVNEGRGGVELLRMGSQGGTVIPLGQTRALPAGGGGDRHFHITVDARNSVTPAGFADQISRTVLTRAAEMDAASLQGARRGLPAAQARYDKLGTTG